MSPRITRITRIYFLCLFCALCVLFFSCTKRENIVSEETAALPDLLWVCALETAASVDDHLLAAQVLITGIDGNGYLPPHMRALLEETPAGGVMLFSRNLNTDNDSIRALIAETVSLINDKSGIPPFIAVDQEGGTVNRFRRGTADLPAASAYYELFQKETKEAALVQIEIDSLKAGREIAALGINMNFAPVAETLNDDNRYFLESRSYGADPLFTAEAAAAFVRGMELAKVLCVVKHFPGSAGTDPHYTQSVIDRDKIYLNNLVFPFTALFNKNTRAVMVAHTLVPALDDKIASLSPIVMNDWLRDELGFDGLIIADDFSMAAAGDIRSEEAAVSAIAAGADMVLVWQHNLARTHAEFLSALEDGRLSRERLQEAVTRIIYEKNHHTEFTGTRSPRGEKQ